jgi:hypothetical protein
MNHSLTLSTSSQLSGCRLCALTHSPTLCHIVLTTGHSTNKWFAVSRFRTQSWQKYSFGQCLTRSLAAVHIPSWRSNQMKSRHFGVPLSSK